MADLHYHYPRETPRTTLIDDREGPAAALIIVLALLLVGFLIWFFGFSGVVFGRGPSGGSTTNITNQNNNLPAQQTSGPTYPAP
jgi:hypothetical protein